MTHGQVQNNTQETASYKLQEPPSWVLPDSLTWHWGNVHLSYRMWVEVNDGKRSLTPPTKVLSTIPGVLEVLKIFVEWMNTYGQGGRRRSKGRQCLRTHGRFDLTIPKSIWEWITVDFMNPLMLYKETPQYFQFFYGTFCRYLFQVWILPENLPQFQNTSALHAPFAFRLEEEKEWG